VNREAITAALFERLTAIPGLRTTGRKPKAWDQMAPTDCPCLFLGVGSSQVTTATGQYPLWELDFIVYLYAHDGSQEGPSGKLNDLVDAVSDSMNRDGLDPVGMGTGTATTLGGLVHSVELGSVTTDEGSFGDRAVAMVTLQVLAAG
jgi:hypothetical protein